jgi:thiamine-phosphate pyrophosphorylase|tara:strand:+ start:128 stop:772 length:645 start_codon:yes stop_codon:yes gene_type:complete
LKQIKLNKRFIYLISPNKIKDDDFYIKLDLVLSSKKVNFFQLRLKKETTKNKISIGKKIKKICKKHKVNFIINDEPMLAKKLNSDGCHLGQKDMNIRNARKIIGKKKIIGITCHNSKFLIKNAIKEKINYLAIGAFFKTQTKKVKYKASLSTLKWCKSMCGIPIVAIGGINNINYKKLLLNQADFLAISGYVWENKKLKPEQAIKKLKNENICN